MLLIDEYQPGDIYNIQFHKDRLELLKKISQDNEVPHIIFYGPEESGKKTLINSFLEMIYGKQVNKTMESLYVINGSSSSPTNVAIKQSNYHIEIEPGSNNFDRYIIQDIVKEYAKKVPLGRFLARNTFKVVFINNIENLLPYAQTSLRTTMEKYSKTCRFIMLCRSLSKVIDPLKSRCYCFRVQSPSDNDIFSMLIHVSAKKGIKLKLREHCAIVKKANGSIKKALWCLELKRFNISHNLSCDKGIYRIVKLIMDGNNESIIEIRKLMYKFTTTNIAGTYIIKSIVQKLISMGIHNQLIYDIVEIAADAECCYVAGRRKIMQLDKFTTRVKPLFNTVHPRKNYTKYNFNEL